jgi:hypothetical protein
MFFYHGIPYYEMLFAPSMLGTCVRDRESQSLYALKRLELTLVFMCAFSIFACKRKEFNLK